MAAPASQKAGVRPIGFALVNDYTGTSTTVTLVVRPEDLTRTEPSLLTATQTFGGAFIDDFGPGLATIQIQGHTGWNLGQGWEAEFANLRTTVFDEWHKQRATAVANGQDVNGVRLIFSDALDSIVNVVAPGAFVTRRSKSRPLLMMYQIPMTVIGAGVAPVLTDPLTIQSPFVADTMTAGVTSLQSSISTIQAAIAQANTFLNSQIIGPFTGFMSLSVNAFNQALSVVDATAGLITGNASQLLGIATEFAQVGRNAAWVLGSVANLPFDIANEFAEVASAYENAACVLKNAFVQAGQYPDYSAVYGASGCSSTVGGSPLSPLAGSNPFETFVPAQPPPPAVSPLAASSIATMIALDPVLAPPPVAQLGGLLTAINGGVVY